MARTLLSAQSAHVGTAARKLLPICYPERSQIIRFANDLAESRACPERSRRGPALRCLSRDEIDGRACATHGPPLPKPGKACPERSRRNGAPRGIYGVLSASTLRCGAPGHPQGFAACSMRMRGGWPTRPPRKECHLAPLAPLYRATPPLHRR